MDWQACVTCGREATTAAATVVETTDPLGQWRTFQRADAPLRFGCADHPARPVTLLADGTVEVG